MAKTFISYRRVSTQRQGQSGLGLAAQKTIIDYFVAMDGGAIVSDYCEAHSGKDLDKCPKLHEAMKEAKEKKATLIIAKTDRLRNCQQALQILDEMGEGNVIFCDLPASDRFTLTLFFAIHERERLITSIRTKQALAEAKKQGKQLGNPTFTADTEEARQKASSMRARGAENAAAVHRMKADNSDVNRRAYAAVQGHIAYLNSKGEKATLRALAAFLNLNGFTTSKGKQFEPMQVKRLLERYVK